VDCNVAIADSTGSNSDFEFFGSYYCRIVEFLSCERELVVADALSRLGCDTCCIEYRFERGFG